MKRIYWKARDVEITGTSQLIQVNGEIFAEVPIRVHVNPRAARVVIPVEGGP